MTEEEQKISVQEIAAVEDICQQVLGVSLKEILAIYLESNPEEEITEADLVADILEAGTAQDEGDAVFENKVKIGLISIGSTLGLI